MKKAMMRLVPLLLILCLLLTGCDMAGMPSGSLLGASASPAVSAGTDGLTLENVPAFAEKPYVALQNNIPAFTDADLRTEALEYYSPLDNLGRCGMVYASVCPETMPTEERGSIGSVKPTGWQTAKYDFVDGKYLYNRCHLIGYQLTGENANEENLITGTRYMNVDGMLPFENMVADYVKETGNHVMYRVTPVFRGDELVARGVVMEALSVEDDGEGICFHVYVYNNQPGVTIDYATGDNWPTEEESAAVVSPAGGAERMYVLNTKSNKFHFPNCAGAASISEKNREMYTGTREALLQMGYDPCGQCKP